MLTRNAQLIKWVLLGLLLYSMSHVGSGAESRRDLAQHQVFWGDVHGHTSHSDGKGSLDDYFTHARDVSKLDFAMVTDHDFGNAATKWPHPSFSQPR